MEKIELIRKYWKAEGAKKINEVLSCFAEDADFSSPAMNLRGRKNIEKFYQGMVNDFKQIAVTITHWIEQDDEVAVEYDCELIRATGEHRFAKGFNLFRIKDNTIQSLRCYFNPADF